MSVLGWSTKGKPMYLQENMMNIPRLRKIRWMSMENDLQKNNSVNLKFYRYLKTLLFDERECVWTWDDMNEWDERRKNIRPIKIKQLKRAKQQLNINFGWTTENVEAAKVWESLGLLRCLFCNLNAQGDAKLFFNPVLRHNRWIACSWHRTKERNSPMEQNPLNKWMTIIDTRWWLNESAINHHGDREQQKNRNR